MYTSVVADVRGSEKVSLSVSALLFSPESGACYQSCESFARTASGNQQVLSKNQTPWLHTAPMIYVYISWGLFFSSASGAKQAGMGGEMFCKSFFVSFSKRGPTPVGMIPMATLEMCQLLETVIHRHALSLAKLVPTCKTFLGQHFIFISVGKRFRSATC